MWRVGASAGRRRGPPLRVFTHTTFPRSASKLRIIRLFLDIPPSKVNDIVQEREHNGMNAFFAPGENEPPDVDSAWSLAAANLAGAPSRRLPSVSTVRRSGGRRS